MTWEEKLAEERYYERSANIINVIKELNASNLSKEQIIHIVSNSFKITQEEAQKYYDKELAIK